MKFFISILLVTSFFTLTGNVLFTEDLLVKDFNGKEVNLKDIEITKDTVMIFAWCKTCGSCIKRLDWLKTNNKEKNYQIIAVAITQDDSITKEKSIIEKHLWPFQLYYDDKQNLGKYLGKKGYYKNPFTKKNEEEIHGFPLILMFVKNNLLCSSCDKYIRLFSK